MKEMLEKIREQAEKQIAIATTPEALDEIKVSVLGKKGELTQILKGMKDVSPEERPKVGQMVNTVRDALELALKNIKHKQSCTGTTAAYGFGAYLFENHKDDYSKLIAQYANISCTKDNHGIESLSLKYSLYSKYPSSSGGEAVAFEKLEDMMKNVVVRESSFSRFALGVFKYLQRRDILNRLAPYISTPKDGSPFRTLSKDGCFCLKNILCDYSTPPKTMYSGPFIIGESTYYLRLNLWGKRDINTNYFERVDDFINMITYIYHGQLDIDETGLDFVLIDCN